MTRSQLKQQIPALATMNGKDCKPVRKSWERLSQERVFGTVFLTAATACMLINSAAGQGGLSSAAAIRTASMSEWYCNEYRGESVTITSTTNTPQRGGDGDDDDGEDVDHQNTTISTSPAVASVTPTDSAEITWDCREVVNFVGANYWNYRDCHTYSEACSYHGNTDLLSPSRCGDIIIENVTLYHFLSRYQPACCFPGWSLEATACTATYIATGLPFVFRDFNRTSGSLTPAYLLNQMNEQLNQNCSESAAQMNRTNGHLFPQNSYPIVVSGCNLNTTYFMNFLHGFRSIGTGMRLAALIAEPVLRAQFEFVLIVPINIALESDLSSFAAILSLARNGLYSSVLIENHIFRFTQAELNELEAETTIRAISGNRFRFRTVTNVGSSTLKTIQILRPSGAVLANVLYRIRTTSGFMFIVDHTLQCGRACSVPETFPLHSTISSQTTVSSSTSLSTPGFTSRPALSTTYMSPTPTPTPSPTFPPHAGISSCSTSQPCRDANASCNNNVCQCKRNYFGNGDVCLHFSEFGGNKCVSIPAHSSFHYNGDDDRLENLRFYPVYTNDAQQIIIGASREIEDSRRFETLTTGQICSHSMRPAHSSSSNFDLIIETYPDDDTTCSSSSPNQRLTRTGECFSVDGTDGWIFAGINGTSGDCTEGRAHVAAALFKDDPECTNRAYMVYNPVPLSDNPVCLAAIPAASSNNRTAIFCGTNLLSTTEVTIMAGPGSLNGNNSDRSSTMALGISVGVLTLIILIGTVTWNERRKRQHSFDNTGFSSYEMDSKRPKIPLSPPGAYSDSASAESDDSQDAPSPIYPSGGLDNYAIALDDDVVLKQTFAGNNDSISVVNPNFLGNASDETTVVDFMRILDDSDLEASNSVLYNSNIHGSSRITDYELIKSSNILQLPMSNDSMWSMGDRNDGFTNQIGGPVPPPLPIVPNTDVLFQHHPQLSFAQNPNFLNNFESAHGSQRIREPIQIEPVPLDGLEEQLQQEIDSEKLQKMAIKTEAVGATDKPPISKVTLKKSKKPFKKEILDKQEDCHELLQAAVESAFARLEIAKDREPAASALMTRIVNGDVVKPKKYQPCFRVQRKNLASKSAFQVQVGGARIVIQKVLFATYRKIKPGEMGTSQVYQKCCHNDDSWWCFEPTHLEKCPKDHIPPSVRRNSIPREPDAMFISKSRKGRKVIASIPSPQTDSGSDSAGGSPPVYTLQDTGSTIKTSSV